MGTRLRPILSFCGELRAGGNVRRSLEMWCKQFGVIYPTRGSMPEEQRLAQMFKVLVRDRPDPAFGANFLWMFREPRRVVSRRSRYSQLCEHFGIPPQRTKKKKLSIFRDTPLVSERLARQLTREREQQREIMEQQIRAQTPQAQAVNPLQSGAGGAFGQQPANWFVMDSPSAWGQGTNTTWANDNTPATATTTPPEPAPVIRDWEFLDMEDQSVEIEP